MSVALQFLQAVSDFLTKVLSYDVIPGISLFVVLIYNLLLSVVFTVCTRRS